MPRLFHSSRFYHPNNIWWAVQIIKLLIMQFSPLPCYLVPLRSKYSPQRSILKHPQPTFLSQCEHPSFTPTQNKWQNYTSVYLYIFRQQTGRQKILQRMIARISGLQSVLNFFLNGISMRYGVPKYLKFSTLSKELLPFFILWLRPAFWSRGITMYLVLSAFLSSPISLLGTTKVSVFSFTVCMPPPNILTSSSSSSYLSCNWATCWPVPVSCIQKSLQRSTMIPPASWRVVFHYPG